MPLIPNDDPEALAELLGYLGEIGYGELYLRRAPAAAAAGVAGPGVAGPGVVTAAGGERSGGAAAAAAEAVDELVAAARQAGGATPERSGSQEGGAEESAEGAAERAAALGAMAEVVAACRRCRLCEGRQKTVFGSGDPNADLMFIGEGPGAEEDRQGLPFVGRAGELLTRIIEAIGMTRDQVYIANIVKCRPPGNRDPQPDEVAACRSYLERQVALVRPRLLVALGRIAAQTLLGNDLPIGRMRGQWFEVLGVPLMVTYHPAALLRNPALKRPTWEDMQQVRDRLQAAG
ncbi:MAG TPA: uracil-DNA glycosylase [Thermoanaerobaculia bacterium]